MFTHPIKRRSRLACALFTLLNPIPFGFFVAALIFDMIYARSGDVLWGKSAAWLIIFGLLFAILPRLINLISVWNPKNRASYIDKLDFWLNGIGIIASIVNAFVHSRDAYAVIPEGLLLSALTVVLMSLGLVLIAVQRSTLKGNIHE